MQSGRVLIHPAVARDRFRQLTSLSESNLDLSEAALVIALEEYPSLDVGHYMELIDRWSESIRERVEGSGDIERIVDEINRLLFTEEGFHGEEGDYFDPRNAFLNEVLERHAGVPLSLSVVYIEISRRLGLAISGVSLPGRFLVKLSGIWGEIVVDPFDGGRVLSTAECQAIMDQVYGGAVRLREHHLRSFSKKEILARLLSHLKSAYLSRHDPEKAVASVDRLLILDESDPYELRDRAALAMQVHRYGEAIEFLERYLRAQPQAEDRNRVREEIDYLKAWLQQN